MSSKFQCQILLFQKKLKNKATELISQQSIDSRRMGAREVICYQNDKKQALGLIPQKIDFSLECQIPILIALLDSGH